MKCPRCGNEAAFVNGEIQCSICNPTQPSNEPPEIIPTEPSFFSKYQLLTAVSAWGLGILFIGGAWNIALINDSGIEMLFWLFVTVPIWFGLTWLLISIPFWLPASLLFAWLFDRAKLDKRGVQLRYLLLVNAWTIASAMLFIILAHATADINFMELTDYLTDDTMFVTSFKVGLGLIPILWSLYAINKFKGAKKRLLVPTVVTVLAIGINIAAVIVYPSVTPLTSREREAAYDASELSVEKQVALSRQRDAASIASIKQLETRLKDKITSTSIDFAPYSLPEDQYKLGEKKYDYLPYYTPTLSVEYRDSLLGYRLTQTKTLSPTPQPKSYCYPTTGERINYDSYSKSKYGCQPSFITMKGIKVYCEQTPYQSARDLICDNEIFTTHLFVINDVFFRLNVNSCITYKCSKGPVDTAKLNKLIDSLQPTTRSFLP